MPNSSPGPRPKLRACPFVSPRPTASAASCALFTPGLSLAKVPGLAAGLDDVSTVGESVDHRLGKPGAERRLDPAEGPELIARHARQEILRAFSNRRTQTTRPGGSTSLIEALDSETFQAIALPARIL